MSNNSHGNDPIPGQQIPAALALQLSGESSNAEIRYLIFVPQEYRSDGPEWPLLLFLHGAGERGDDLELVATHGPPNIVKSTPDFPFVVVSPQCPAYQRWRPDELIQLVDHISANYRIDRRRIYVTGLSMGGYGTWALCAQYPDKFAAAVPICGGGNLATAGKLARKTPVWAFHGQQDRIVVLQQSAEMVQALEAAGGNVKFTVYPESGHDSWTETYNNPSVYGWMLQQQREPIA
jgi:predicted peptidase